MTDSDTTNFLHFVFFPQIFHLFVIIKDLFRALIAILAKVPNPPQANAVVYAINPHLYLTNEYNSDQTISFVLVATDIRLASTIQ